MPKKLPVHEDRFVRGYVREGGVPEKLREVEKRLRLKAGTGAALLKLKRVRDAIEAQMAPVRLEQERQKLVGAAVAEVTAKLEAENAELKAQQAAILALPSMTVMGNTAVIEQELMRLVRLCPEKHGRIKLASIQTAFVVAGLMEQGNTRRVSPPDDAAATKGAGIYTALFDPMRQAREALTPPAEAVPAELSVAAPLAPAPVVLEAEQVFDLTPPPAAAAPKTVQSKVNALPVEGESIAVVAAVAHKQQAKSRAAASVVTVEVG